MRAVRRPRAWGGAWVALLAATLVVCLLPVPPTGVDLALPHLDKAGHFGGYAALGAWGALLCTRPRQVWALVVGLAAYGACIEGLQGLVPWRSADGWDAVANALGAGTGAALGVTPLRDWLLGLEARLG